MSGRAVGTLKSVETAKKRFSDLGRNLGTCSVQALAYGKCVSAKDVTRGVCQAEFDALKECMKKASEKLK